MAIDKSEGNEGAAQDLVVKNVDRVERIHAPHAQYIEASFINWQIHRYARRDLNLVIAYLFEKARRAHLLAAQPSDQAPSSPDANDAPEEFPLRGRLKKLVLDVQDEAEALTNITRKYEMPTVEAVVRMPVRIVSEEAKILCDSLVAADRALTKLLHGPMAEVADDNFDPFRRAFERLRRAALGQNKRKP